MSPWEVRVYDSELDEIVADHPEFFHLEVMSQASHDYGFEGDEPPESYVWIGVTVAGKTHMICLTSETDITITVEEEGS